MGAPPLKLVLGIPAYGRSWTVRKTGNTEAMGPPLTANGAGAAGPMSMQKGILSYNEICLNIQNKGWTEVDDMNGPYAFGHNQWIGYDTIKSTQMKTQYVLDRGLGGAMIWELSSDDFNVCIKEIQIIQTSPQSKINLLPSFFRTNVARENTHFCLPSTKFFKRLAQNRIQ